MTIVSNTKKGYYILEVTMLLPIVIVGILTLAYVIKSVGVTENIAYSSCDESKYLSIRSYNLKSTLGFGSKLEDRINLENEDLVYSEVKNMGYLYYMNGNDGLISFDVSYKIETNLPMKMYGDIENEDSFLFRAFVGKKSKWPPLGFDAFEISEEGDLVWVFMEAGTKFHKESCTYVKAETRQAVLTKTIMKKYSFCNKCDSKKNTPGTIIYYFPYYGEKYHNGYCKSVKRYVTEISKNQAIDRGFSNCIKCGG